MTRFRSVTASVAYRRSRASQPGGCVVLSTAHASATSIQLCFEQGPRRLAAPSPQRLGFDNRWAIVLAGGSGTRLASLTTRADGTVVPKQYCSLQGSRSFLGDTLARADGLVGAQRVAVVVAAQHASFWKRELDDRHADNVIVQPRNRGTAAGVLLPLMSIVARDPSAQVVLLPSDHFVDDEALLARALDGALRTASSTGRVVLLGIQPDAAETDYGWIQPGCERDGVRSVERFVEKPDQATAVALMRSGAVWNSFLLAGKATALLGLFERRLPLLLGAFREAGLESDMSLATSLYESLGEADFCRDVLTGSEDALRLQVVPSCGWTDLGTPSRVAQCSHWLERSGRGASRPGSLGALATATFV